MALTKVSSGLISADASSVDLNIDAGTLYIDATNNKVGIGTSSPSSFGTGANNLVVGSGSGDEGISIYSGSANTSRLYFADGTSAGAQYDGFIVYNHSSQLMSFGTGATGAQSLNIDSSGNVGIGTSSPQKTLDVAGSFAISNSTTSYWDFDRNNSTGDLYVADTGTDRIVITTAGDIQLGSSLGNSFYNGSINAVANKSTGAVIKTRNGNGNDHIHLIGDSNIKYGALGLSTSVGSADAVLEANLNLRFNTGGSNERMRIDSSGKVSIGTTSALSNAALTLENTANTKLVMRMGTASAGSFWRQEVDASNIYYIINQSSTGVYISSGSTSWTAISDENKKENIVELTGALDKVKNYRCVEYNLIADETKSKKIGFIAQDWQKDYNQVVSQQDDGTLGLQYTETIPVLLKAIQEQQVLIEQLQAEVALLKGE